jgi:hypothetical protein
LKTFLIIVTSTAISSTLLFASAARADYISLGTPNLNGLDALCKAQFMHNAYAKELNTYAGICGVDNSEDRNVSVAQVCVTQFGGTNGVYSFDYDSNENMCKGYTYNSDHGKGNNTIGGAQENPWWNPWGW